MKTNPKISIVTPTYNSEKYLEECILSIKDQKYEMFEHIIVDGGSTDETLSIIKRYENTYPLKWISEPDGGMYDAIAKGFKMATGDIFSWLNSDDFYFPWTLAVVSKTFQKKHIDWLTGIPSNTKEYGESRITYQLPNLPVVFNTEMIKKGVYDGKRMCFIQQESCFWTNSLYQKAGGIDVRQNLAGDYYLWKNFANYTRLYTVHCNLASFRIHKGQKSDDMKAYYDETGRKDVSRFMQKMIQVYLQLYSLKNYRKYVVNLEEVFGN